jgi:hypothetical protein
MDKGMGHGHSDMDWIWTLGIKGAVSPDIVFYFRVYTFKSVLLVSPLGVF